VEFVWGREKKKCHPEKDICEMNIRKGVIEN